MPGKPPGPEGVVDAVFDTVLAIPKLPSEVAQRVGQASASMGNEMEAAVRKSTDFPDDELPDPITVVSGAIDYVLSIPKGAATGARGVFDGILQTAGDVQSRWRRVVN
jgi:hypothetical protein